MSKLPLLLAPLLLAPVVLAAPVPGHVVAYGLASHDLVYRDNSVHPTVYRLAYGERACHGAGEVVVDVDLAAGKLVLQNADTSCIPGWTTLSSGCGQDADGTVRCSYDSATVRIRMTLDASGAFLFTYDAPTFSERIAGTLTRA